MSTEPPREHPSAYFVQDRSNQDEMERLKIQDKMVTAGMGGVLPELSDPGSLQYVLDVGCGTGGWLIETARSYPTIRRLVGVDISEKMLEYAQDQATKQGLDKRVQFRTADVLRSLPFADDFFDLVNQRLGISWLRTWEWRKLLLEYQRVCRPGGIIRITEAEVGIECNSPALMKIWDIVLDVHYHSGRLFTGSKDGLTGALVRLMVQHGIEDVEYRVYPMVYRAGEESGEAFYKDMVYLFRLGLPFLQKWTRVPSDYEQMCQQAFKDMQEPDFVATWKFLTAWGTVPKAAGSMLMRGLQ